MQYEPVKCAPVEDCNMLFSYGDPTRARCSDFI